MKQQNQLSPPNCRSWIILVLILLSPFFPGFAYAQNSSGSIKGNVIESGSKLPAEYVTVLLTDSAGKTVNGITTKADGSFELQGIPTGKYKLQFESVSHEKYSIDLVSITADKKNIRLKDVTLTSITKTMTGVTVTAKSKLIENKLDKIVYNAANDITSQGGVAIDILKKVPQVSVDLDGNVELQGNSSIRFLINGKPSAVFGNNLADVLSSIPASQIKSIEAITSPGARYDAQGTGGVINIILKDNKAKGMNGSLSGSLGSRMENGSINLNARNNNFGINAFFSGNAQLRSHTPNTYSRISPTTQLIQDGYSEFKRNGYQTGMGLDWDLSQKQNLTANIGFNRYGNDGRGITNQQQITDDGITREEILSDRFSTSSSYTKAIEWSLAYKRKMKKDGEELSLQYNDGVGLPRSSYLQYQTYKGQSLPFAGSMSQNPGRDREAEIMLDYVLPVNDGFELETGIKTVIQDIHSTANVLPYNISKGDYTLDPLQSYTLNYHRNIYAAYISGSFSLGKILDIKTGLRYENTRSTIDFPGANIHPYNTWAPSVILSHKFTNESSLKLSYNRRIERPDYGDLNPFVNLADPYNISTGNPALRPEVGNNFELGFNQSFTNGVNLSVSALARLNTDEILNYVNFLPDYQVGDSLYQNVSLASRANLGSQDRLGANISATLPLTKKFTIRTNLFGSHIKFVNKLLSNEVTKGWEARLNANLTYEFTPKLVAEGFVNYRTAGIGVQGKRPSFLTYTIAMRQFLANKKASIGITVTNPFNKYTKQVSIANSGDYTSRNIRYQPYQSFGINFTYKFGRLEFKKQKEEDKSFLNPSGQGG
jgi:outer membrane receptor protein involved in Fe transport